MKVKLSQGFFSANAVTKQSKSGNSYISIGVSQAKKGQDGNYEKTYFNMIEPRDLLVLSNICKDLYSEIESQRYKERFGESNNNDYYKPDNKTWDIPAPDMDEQEIPF